MTEFVLGCLKGHGWGLRWWRLGWRELEVGETRKESILLRPCGLGLRTGTCIGVGSVIQCSGHGIAGISYFTFILLFVVYIKWLSCALRTCDTLLLGCLGEN